MSITIWIEHYFQCGRIVMHNVVIEIIQFNHLYFKRGVYKWRERCVSCVISSFDGVAEKHLFFKLLVSINKTADRTTCNQFGNIASNIHWTKRLKHPMHPDATTTPLCWNTKRTSMVMQFMMTSSNGNIFRVTGPSCGEFTGPGDFPAQGKWRGALMFSLICAWITVE